MAAFNFSITTKVDVVGFFGDIYILWNNRINIKSIALTKQEVYLFVKVPPFAHYFYLTAVYAKPYLSSKHIF